MNFRRKIAYFFSSGYRKMKRFIRKLFHRIHLSVKSFIISRELGKRIWELIVYGVEIAINLDRDWETK